METAKKLLEWFNGKKTVIGGLAANLVVWAVLKGKLDPETAELVMIFVTTLTGAGMLHKGAKAVKAGKAE